MGTCSTNNNHPCTGGAVVDSFHGRTDKRSDPRDHPSFKADEHEKSTINNFTPCCCTEGAGMTMCDEVTVRGSLGLTSCGLGAKRDSWKADYHERHDDPDRDA